MKQISLEDKVNNTLKWLANQIASIQVYHWDEEYKRRVSMMLGKSPKAVQERY